MKEDSVSLSSSSETNSPNPNLSLFVFAPTQPKMAHFSFNLLHNFEHTRYARMGPCTKYIEIECCTRFSTRPWALTYRDLSVLECFFVAVTVHTNCETETTLSTRSVFIPIVNSEHGFLWLIIPSGIGLMNVVGS